MPPSRSLVPFVGHLNIRSFKYQNAVEYGMVGLALGHARK